MIDEFKSNHLADKFYTPDLLFNTEKLKREIQPFVDEADKKCEFLFFQSPLGIAVLILALLLTLTIICCLIRCIHKCCKD